MRGLLFSSVAALALAVTPALAEEAKDTAAAGGESWYDSIRDDAAISGDELWSKYTHVEEELAEADAAPHPPYVPIGGE
jgi:hypothetical protein